MIRSCSRALAWCVLGALSLQAGASPWLAPGDEALRADIQLLADAGILRGPVTTWPLSWPDVARDALGANPQSLDEALGDALLRVQRLARDAMAHGSSGLGMRVSVASDVPAIRTFTDAPREDGEAALRAGWLGSRIALNLQGAAVANASDDQTFRPDGTYLGVNIGNFMISAGWMERWWGPGWDSSLILSSNARPIPSLTLERNYTDPFKTKLLSWIGPWRASIAVGQMEESDVPVTKVRFLAARLNFRPVSWLEFGLTRTAQWCGEGRPCGWRSFTDLLIGHDNQIVDGSTASQPGNQMAGYDLRLRSPWRPLPVAFYSQWIGEDEAGGLPSKFLGLFGLETWFSTPLGAARAHVEYSDTSCNFSRQRPEFDCGYRNNLYPQGYAYRGRSIGQSLDSDSRLLSIGALVSMPDGDVIGVNLRHAEVNRDGSFQHAISPVPFDLDDVELRYSRLLGAGKITVSVTYDHSDFATSTSSDVRGYLGWQQGF